MRMRGYYTEFMQINLKLLNRKIPTKTQFRKLIKEEIEDFGQNGRVDKCCASLLPSPPMLNPHLSLNKWNDHRDLDIYRVRVSVGVLS